VLKINILYFLITLFATTVGSTTGMGGGVIIKPVLDAFGHYGVDTVSVLSSISVFAMSIVSILKKMKVSKDIKLNIAVLLAIGSIIGGYLGNLIFKIAITNQNANIVKIIQNSVLAILLIIIFIYMQNKEKIHSFEFEGLSSAVLIGFSLGVVSSFLGIGGGPINVVAFIFFFSYSAKTATFASLITIFFSQASKLISILFSTGFGIYDFTVLPYMLIGAIAGGFLGSEICKRLSEKNVVLFFNIIQILIFLICLFNIYNSLSPVS